MVFRLDERHRKLPLPRRRRRSPAQIADQVGELIWAGCMILLWCLLAVCCLALAYVVGLALLSIIQSVS